ncbi:MAG: GDCCVxC domain-containing (seleno)protein [Methylocystis sp.]
MIVYSTLTCPKCGVSAREAMPTDACVYFYQCTSCGVLLKPKQGDCCVFCSYGDTPCPPIQHDREGVSAPGCCGERNLQAD